MTAQQKIAKLLRTPEEVILELEEKMNRITGKTGILENIERENQERVEQKLNDLNVKKRDAKTIYGALIKKVSDNDKALFNLFHKPKFNTAIGCKTLVNFVVELAGKKEGFFLSLQKAEDLLKLNPPANILKFMKCKTVDDLLINNDILEIFSALRFAEDSHWLNDVFFRPYNNLKETDFEKREIQVRVLPEKWLKIGSKFTGKKLHNISHLKELGIIFVVPFKGQFIGQTIEIFTLLLHYFYEIDFYSGLFKNYSASDDFGHKMVSALRGDVGGLPLPDENKITWRIVQRYLAKDDLNDPRLLEPHINPEAIHWAKAQKSLAKLAFRFPDMDLGFWDGLDRIGEYFPLNHIRNNISNGANNHNSEILISFDLIDNAISLSKKTTVLSKYLYHQQEALWNKIFIDYIGKEKTEELVKENLNKGYITLEDF